MEGDNTDDGTGAGRKVDRLTKLREQLQLVSSFPWLAQLVEHSTAPTAPRRTHRATHTPSASCLFQYRAADHAAIDRRLMSGQMAESSQMVAMSILLNTAGLEMGEMGKPRVANTGPWVYIPGSDPDLGSTPSSRSRSSSSSSSIRSSSRSSRSTATVKQGNLISIIPP